MSATEETTERETSRRMSVTMTLQEQSDRVVTSIEDGKASDAAAKVVRRASVTKAISLAEQERVDRMNLDNTDKVEQEERARSRRESVKMSTEEQLRRVQTNAEAQQQENQDSKEEIDKNRKASVAAMEKERGERIQAAASASAEGEKDVKIQRKESIQMAVGLAEKERLRRIDEANNNPGEVAKERKENQKLASEMVDVEQARRIKEDQDKA